MPCLVSTKSEIYWWIVLDCVSGGDRWPSQSIRIFIIGFPVRCGFYLLFSLQHDSRQVLSTRMSLPTIESPTARYRYFQVITFKQPLTAVIWIFAIAIYCQATHQVLYCFVFVFSFSLVYSLHVTLPIRTRMVSRSHHKINNISIPIASLMQRGSKRKRRREI